MEPFSSLQLWGRLRLWDLFPLLADSYERSNIFLCCKTHFNKKFCQSLWLAKFCSNIMAKNWAGELFSLNWKLFDALLQVNFFEILQFPLLRLRCRHSIEHYLLGSDFAADSQKCLCAKCLFSVKKCLFIADEGFLSCCFY